MSPFKTKTGTRRPGGFTLIELMIVVMIILVLAAVGIPNYLGYRESGLAAKCVARMRAIQNGRVAFFAGNPTLSALSAPSAVLPWCGLHLTMGNDSAVAATYAQFLCCPIDEAQSYVFGLNATDITDLPQCPYYDAATHPGHLLELD